MLIAAQRSLRFVYGKKFLLQRMDAPVRKSISFGAMASLTSPLVASGTQS